MLEGFKPITLTTGAPLMTVTSNGVTFSKASIERLERPPYVIPLMNKAEKMFAVQVVEESNENATKFFNPQKKIVSVRWNNSDLLSRISEMMGWDLDNESYRIPGTFSEDDMAIIYDLKKAEKMVTK